MGVQHPAPSHNKSTRPWLQFRLRSLLLAILVFCIAMGWFVKRVRRQQAATARIVGYGGHVNYDYQFDAKGEFRRDSFGNALHGLEPPGPRWLRDMVGDDYFQTPVKVWLESEEGVGFLDGELKVLAGPIKSLPRVKSLTLRGSPITDAGLTHLHGMTQLEELDCRGTKITDRGIEALRRALPSCRITR